MSVQKNAIEAKKVLTESRNLDLRVSKAELDALRLIAQANGESVEQVIATIFHRSVQAELDITFESSTVADGLRKRLMAEHTQLWAEV